MSINTIAAGVLAVAGLGGATVFAATNPAIQADFKNVRTSIVNKDLTGYKAAKNQLINDRSAQEVTKVNATTQDQLNTMSDKQAKRTAVQTVITNNDYNAFKASSEANMLTRTPDQASFDKLVAQQKAHAAESAALSEAIKNNDFNAYKTLEKTEEQNDPTENNGKPEKVQTDTQLQKRFDQMVADYKASGTLPSDNKGMMGGHGGMDEGIRGNFGGKSGDRGHKGGNWNKNKTATSSASAPTPVIQ